MHAGLQGGGRGGAGVGWGVGACCPDSANKVHSKSQQSNANLPLKYTKLIGVEGHAHKQRRVIKCAPRRGKYRQFSGFKWEGGSPLL